MGYELPHEGEYLRVIGGGGQHQLVIAEGVLHGLGHVRAGQVVYDHLRAALLPQLLRELLHGLFGVAVDGGVGYHDALALGGIGGPEVVFLDIVPQILLEHRPVGGADYLYVQPRRFL